jgi:hypothetical protein
MPCRIPVSSFALALICASTVLASAQVSSTPTEASSDQLAPSSPVAYVYVASTPSTGKDVIRGYAAAANGSLTNLSGSPYSTSVFYLALNGAWLFGTNGIQIDSYVIAANGSLRLADTFTAGNTGGGPIDLFLDHTGKDLYSGFANLQGTDNNGYQSYGINQARARSLCSTALAEARLWEAYSALSETTCLPIPRVVITSLR